MAKKVEKIEKILFIRLRLMGDIIFTIPSILMCRKYYPNAEFYYVVEEEFKDIGSLIPEIKELIVIPRKMNLMQMLAFRKKMHKIGFDYVVDLHSGPKSAQLTRLSGGKIRIGYHSPSRNWAYNRKVSRDYGKVILHSVDNQTRLLKHLYIPINLEPTPDYPAVTIDESKISDWVKTLALGKNKDNNLTKEIKIVIHVGAGNNFRDWGLQNFSTLIQKLLNHFENSTDTKLSIFLIGNSEEEKNKGLQLEKLFGVTNLTGKLSLFESLYLISHSNVYVGADSGPLHLATLT
ncbi:MAG TPA: glycosyltransferase family 9 protein, partial [Candidatus Deferrimicrobium sp.]|nr:glycosyltransferase family 9 protein [Candidatus Deferrimicrobium sp.]